MFLLRIPNSYHAERSYISRVMLNEFLGFDVEVVSSDRSCMELTRRDDPTGRCLFMPDGLFATSPSDWLTERSNPSFPAPTVDPIDFGCDGPAIIAGLPLLYGSCQSTPRGAYWIDDRGLFLNADLLGSAFWILTRYEELTTPLEDKMGQVPATATRAHREGWVSRPIVNEYVEILAWAIRKLWPSVRRPQRKPRMFLTHDVDYPWATSNTGVARVLRAIAADMIRHHAPDSALRRLGAWLVPEPFRREMDPYNTFDFLMSLSEEYGLKSEFYFIADRSNGVIDGNYDLDDPWVRSLLRRIHNRGHSIGLHPSFFSYLDAERTLFEFESLRRACQEEGIEQEEWGGRQHWLRWRNPTTWQNWEDAGLGYDSSLAFFDQVGFRSGVCYEYPTFNLLQRNPLRLRERPLIVMDCTPPIFMKKAWREIPSVVEEMVSTCFQYCGDFTLLWHNSFLSSTRQRRCYRRIVRRGVEHHRRIA